MDIISHIQAQGATHFFTLDGVGTSNVDDLGNSGQPTRIRTGTYSFAAGAVCEGASQCVLTTTTSSSGVDGAVIDNRQDINGGGGENTGGSMNYVNGSRSILLWASTELIQNPTCIYEQGGGTNNFAFIGSAQMSFQAADDGSPFLIAQTKFLAEPNRPYMHVGIWEYYTTWGGAGNRLTYYVNGVLQGTMVDGTSGFPGHSGDVVIGNSGDALKSFNGSVLTTQSIANRVNYLAMFNNVVLDSAWIRDLFERMVKPEIIISADTVANQQAAIDAYKDTEFDSCNCRFRILQATDATDYELYFDNIKFKNVAESGDIDVQYVGPNNLTIYNANGSNVEVVCCPPEVDVDGTGLNNLVGGGTITVSPKKVLRYPDSGNITNVMVDDIVLLDPGEYLFENVIVDNVINLSGGLIEIYADEDIPIITNVGSSSTQVSGIAVDLVMEDYGTFTCQVLKDESELSPIAFNVSSYNISPKLDSNYRIIFLAFGKKVKIINLTGIQLIKNNIITLSDDDLIDTAIPTTTLDAIAASISTTTYGDNSVSVNIVETLEAYTPNEVLTGLQYWLCEGGDGYITASLSMNATNILVFGEGSVKINTDLFYIKPDESWDESTKIVPVRGVYLPLVIYGLNESSAPIRQNSYGVTLCHPKWTEKSTQFTYEDLQEIHDDMSIINEGVKKASLIVPHNIDLL